MCASLRPLLKLYMTEVIAPEESRVALIDLVQLLEKGRGRKRSLIDFKCFFLFFCVSLLLFFRCFVVFCVFLFIVFVLFFCVYLGTLAGERRAPQS